MIDRLRMGLACCQLTPMTPILLAFSGGGDSVCLAHLITGELGYSDVHLVHFDHGLRSAPERDTEYQLVRQFADTRRLRWDSFCLPVTASARQSGKSIEEAARDLRYDHLLRLATEKGRSAVITAHHADDNTESILMKWIRGSRAGLTPMQMRRPLSASVQLVRPMLGIQKWAIRRYLAEEGLPYIEDSSNRSRRFLRNRVRHELVPLLQALNPSYAKAVAGTADYIQEFQAFINRQLAPILKRAHQKEGALYIDRAIVTDLDPFLQAELIRRLITQRFGADYRVSSIQIHAIVAQLSKTGCRQVSLPKRYWCVISKHKVMFLDRLP